MIFKYFVIDCIIWCLIIVLQCAEVLCQVCVETKMSYRDVPETYLYTYMEAYEKSNCLFWCTDTRVATAVGTRTVRKLMAEQVNVCCEGYVKDEHVGGNSIHCKPFCSVSCINGYCKSPELCACNPGYLMDGFDAHKCSPMCVKGCDHGTCVAPNTCRCDAGYEMLNEVCEPVCSEPCYNGSCVAPETCQCHPGFKKSDNNTCEPYCSGYTASGECIVTIICEKGWIKVIKGAVEVCEPLCTEPCNYGTCVAPNTCECFEGYKDTMNGSCEPNCSSGCLHGNCVSPEICVCEPGWYQKESSSACLAHCDHKCGNGTCIAPNVCECFSGYELNEFMFQENEELALCVPVCNNCEGTCVAPDKCVCESPLEMMHVTADGGPCDCLENCSNEDNKCGKTICVNNTIIVRVTEAVLNDDVEEATEDLSATDVDNDTAVNRNYSDYNKLKIENASWFNSNWFYVIGCIAICAVVIVVITITILRRRYFKFLNRNIFNWHVSDNGVSTAVHYKQNSSS